MENIKIIKKALFLIGLLTTCGYNYAAPMGDKVAVCYIFKADKLKSSSPCILSTGYGAGGSYESMKIGQKSYDTETQICYDKKKDDNVECGISLNDKEATRYYRNLFYKKISDDSLINQDYLSCYVTKDKKIDICVKRN